MEFTSKDEIAVCNLASFSLPMFVENKKFNHDLFYTVTKRVTRNLNKVIDRNYYPVKKEKILINAQSNWS
jgi:ribonucleoside-diphosphate reductase alpha chain